MLSQRSAEGIHGCTRSTRCGAGTEGALTGSAPGGLGKWGHRGAGRLAPLSAALGSAERDTADDLRNGDAEGECCRHGSAS